MMFKKVVKKVSWEYALTEIVLIFIGITAAIWFNNWNEARQARKIEIKSLMEIKSALSQDIKDIEENIFGYSNRKSLFDQWIAYTESNIAPSDSLENQMPFILGYTTFLANTGAFETLKSRGLESISNDSIRSKISLLYDFEYERIQSNEQQHKSHYVNYLKPQILKHFSFSRNGIQPKSYEALKGNTEFNQIINWAFITDSYMLDNYKALKNKTAWLIQSLEKEIYRLNN